LVGEWTTTSAPERERLLEVGRGERVVDHQRARLVGELGRRPRCRRSPAPGWSASRPTRAGCRRPRPSSGVEVGQVDRAPTAAGRRRHLVDQPEGAAVGVVAEQRCARPARAAGSTASSAARPEAKANPWRAPSSGRTRRLERVARRVAAAGVLPALVLAHRPLGERGRRG
jgi:hypothetical protein